MCLPISATTTTGATKASLTYIVATRASEAQAQQPTAAFTLPQKPLALPSTFPGAQAWQGLAVVSYQWEQQQGQKAYQATMVSKEASTAVAARVRDGLKAAGWQITADQPVGFATQLQIQHPGQGLTGRVGIDQLPQDSAYIQVLVQIQGGQAAGKP